MKYIDNSLSFVFVGDFNRKYISFEWLSNIVFQKSMLEMGVNIQNGQTTISYRADNITIVPDQRRVMLQTKRVDEEGMEYFIKCIKNYLNNMPDDLITAYGINSEYHEEDTLVVSKEMDLLSSQKGLVKNGFDLVSIKSSRQVVKEGIVYNIGVSTDSNITNININEDYQGISEKPSINADIFEQHFCRAKEIIESFGFELEELEDE